MSLKDSFLYTDLCKRLAVWPDAIKPEQLLIELEKVEKNCRDFDFNRTLLHAFHWILSPQGIKFWDEVYEKAYPYIEEE